jgi:predicted amidohydrolase YtcJ
MHRARAKKNGPKDRRFRVEHAQHLRQEDIPRFAALGVILSMQPYPRRGRRSLGGEAAREGALEGDLRLSARSTRRLRLAFGSD